MSDMEVQMEGVVKPTYDKRRKGYKFKKDGMEIFIKGENEDAAMKQMSELLESKKQEDAEVTSFAEGGMEDGGLKDEGGSVDPVSGNDVPSGSTQAEVRDDIPAQLSEGEFVLPADVVRYIGLENLMELRAKAKQGLAKMEAMGQMGNSDEATMEDDAEYDGEIDQLIDNFDPNDPSSMEFSQGGVVYAQQGAYIPEQQFSYGYRAPTGYTSPQTSLPQQTAFITDPARVAVGQAPVAVENRTYVGPNGEEIIVPFYAGKPMQGYTIPGGYKYKSPEEKVAETPEIAAPVVQQPDSGGGSDDREREAEREAQMAKDKEINNTLAEYDPDFAKLTADDPFMTGKPTANIAGAIYSGVQTHLGRTAAIEKIAKEYGIDLDQYKNTGLAGVLSKYDDERFTKDIKEKYESLAERAQRKANEKARAPEIAALRAKEAKKISSLTPEQEAVREAQREANLQDTQARAAAIRESDGGGGEGGPDNAGGTTDSYSGDRDADGWGE